MAINVDLETISSGYNITKINTNFQRLHNALDDVLSRSGTAPNQMGADFDLNSNDLLNGGIGNFEGLIVDGIPVEDIVGQVGPEGPAGPPGTDGTNGTNGTNGADGVVQSIVQGTNIIVDNTDPANPIISATGGSGEPSDGDKGDITVSVSGTVWNIDAGVVTTTELGGDITTAGKQLLDDANAAAQLVTLGLTATAAELNVLDGITSSTAELNFTDGVTSAIQTQLDAKAPLASPTFTGTVTIPTPFTLGAVSVLPTGTELNFVDGVTSSIQTQIDGKQPLDSDLTSWAGVTRASGFDTFVATPSSANLKTLVTDETGSGGSLVFATSPAITTPTLTDPIITGTILEDVYTITDGAGFEIDPGNGSIQLITLTANRTPAATNFAAGESVTLMIADGTAFTITWTTVAVTWVGGSAPTLATSGYTVVELWKVGSTIYGAHVGDVA